MKAGQTNNLDNPGWDIIHDAPEERSARVDANIRAAFRALIDDEDTPHMFANISALYRALRTKGLKCSKNAFNKRINSNLGCNREAGIPEDLSRSMISPDQLRPFEAGITHWTGYFNHEFYEMAMTLLPLGFLVMESEEKMSKAQTMRWSSPEAREKMSKMNTGRRCSPETREKMSEAQTGRRHSPEAIEKMIKTKTELLRPKKEAMDKAIEAAIDKFPPPDAIEKMRITHVVKKIANLDANLNENTIINRFCKTKRSFNQSLYDLIRPYLACEAADTAPVVPDVAAKIDARPANILKVAAISCLFYGGR